MSNLLKFAMMLLPLVGPQTNGYPDRHCENDNELRCPESDFCVDASQICSFNVAEALIFSGANFKRCPHNLDHARNFCESSQWRNDTSCIRDGMDQFVSKCFGHRSKQCYVSKLQCNGVYDCIDRSDESEEACKHLDTFRVTNEIDDDKDASTVMGLDFRGVEEVNRVEIEEDEDCKGFIDPKSDQDIFQNIHECKTEDDAQGFRYGNMTQCIHIVVWCNPFAGHSIFKVGGQCGVMPYIVFNSVLCQNETFWKDVPCAFDHFTRCAGNIPGQCRETDCVCRENCHHLCADKSHLVCPIGSSRCQLQEMWTCQDEKHCIHHSLVCDGYQQCPDGSDERPDICQECPRQIQNGKPTMISKATFPCTHRHTGTPICAVPCDGKDDRCLGNFLIVSLETVGVLIVVTLVVAEVMFTFIVKGDTKLPSTEVTDLESRLNALFVEEDAVIIDDFQSLHAKTHFYPGLYTFLSNKKADGNFKAICQNINELEHAVHKENELEKLKCLRKCLGTTDVAKDFFDALQDSGCLDNIKEHLLRKTEPLLNSVTVKILKGISAIVVKVFVYYADLVKDVLLLYFLGGFVFSASKDTAFLLYLWSFTLAAILLPFFANVMLILGDRTLLQLGIVPKIILTTLIPITPAIMIYMIVRNELQQELKPQQTCVIQSKKATLQLKQMLANMKRNETNIEQFNQLVIISLFGLIKASNSPTISLPRGLLDSSGIMLILTLCFSIVSPARSMLFSEVLRNDSHVPGKGQLLLFLNFFIGSLTRLFGFLIFFTPSLGLFDTMMHWKKGSLLASKEGHQIYDVYNLPNGTFIEESFHLKWNRVETYESLTTFNAEMHFFFLMGLLALHFLSVYFIKNLFSLEFRINTNSILKCTNVLHNTFHPTGFQDWSHHYNKEDGNFHRIWSSFKLELLMTHGLMLMEHVLLCLPLWGLRQNIEERNVFLDQFFPQLPEERKSTRIVTILSIVAPFLFLCSSILQYFFTLLYYKYGHPWSNIFKLENETKIGNRMIFKSYATANEELELRSP